MIVDLIIAHINRDETDVAIFIQVPTNSVCKVLRVHIIKVFVDTACAHLTILVAMVPITISLMALVPFAVAVVIALVSFLLRILPDIAVIVPTLPCRFSLILGSGKLFGFVSRNFSTSV